MTSAKINIFDIKKCGYYPPRGRQLRFGSLGDTMTQMKDWVTDKSLSLTSTYELDSESDLNKTYCFKFLEGSGRYLVTLWNEVPSYEGSMPSVNGNQRVGEASVNHTELPTGGIPGFPTYFLIIPQMNIYANIIIENFHSGNPAFVKYMESFLGVYTSYAEDTVTNDGRTLRGYKYEDEVYSENDILPYFIVKLRRKPAQIKYILDNCSQIHKMIRKTSFKTNSEPQLTAMKQLWKFISFGNYNATADPICYNILSEIKHTPVRADLKKMIDDWVDNHETNTTWDNIGFEFRHDNKIKWLSHSIARYEVELPFDLDENGVLKSEDLFEFMNRPEHDAMYEE